MWHDLIIGKQNIGERVTKGSGYFKKSYVYILIPLSEYQGYTFLLSANCVYTEMISLEDDMNLELFMHPDYREKGKRYKRYHMKASELIPLLSEYEDDLFQKSLEREREQEKIRNAKNKTIIGNIVYGRYMGSFDNPADSYSDFFFCHDGIYYNRYHNRVRNVEVSDVLFLNVSKYFYEQVSHKQLSLSALHGRLAPVVEILNAVKSLQAVKSDPETERICQNTIELLEKRKQDLLSQFLEEFEQYI